MKKILLATLVACMLLPAHDADARKRKRYYRKPVVKERVIKPNVSVEKWQEGAEPVLWLGWDQNGTIDWDWPKKFHGFDKRFYFDPPSVYATKLISYHQPEISSVKERRSMLIGFLVFLAACIALAVWPTPRSRWDKRNRYF